MRKFTTTHEINCTSETFWKVFLDTRFNEYLYNQQLGCREFKILEQGESDNNVTRKVLVMPADLNMPAPVAKVMGQAYSYVLTGSFDKQSMVWHFQCVPNTLADKTHYTGSIRIEPLGDDKVHRIADIEYAANIITVGALMESSMETKIRAEYDASAACMNTWLATGKSL
jgi:hypothetical protein